MAAVLAQVLRTPGFATMVTPAPIEVPLGALATGFRWFVGGLEILLVGLMVPVAMLVVGAPLVLAVRLVLALASWL